MTTASPTPADASAKLRDLELCHEVLDVLHEVLTRAKTGSLGARATEIRIVLHAVAEVANAGTMMLREALHQTYPDNLSNLEAMTEEAIEQPSETGTSDWRPGEGWVPED